MQAAVQPAAPPPQNFHYAYVGTYTPNGGGIYLFRLDPATAALTQLQVIDDIRDRKSTRLNSSHSS